MFSTVLFIECFDDFIEMEQEFKEESDPLNVPSTLTEMYKQTTQRIKMSFPSSFFTDLISDLLCSLVKRRIINLCHV